MMKQIWRKHVCLILTGVALAVWLAGCGGTGSDRQGNDGMTAEESRTAGTTTGKNPKAETPATETKSVETASAGSQAGQVPSNESAAGTATPAAGGQAAQPQSQGITEEDAKRIAREHASVSEADISYMRIKLEREHGRDEYDVEFFVGNKEYDYDIDAATGEILSYDYDAESDIPDGTSYVTQEQAKAAAFAHANVSEADVYKLKVEFDQDHGKAEYEVEFEVGHTEYEYVIDAVTCEVISFEVDHD